jgi:L-iditol 2-dehydrogenase
MKQAYMPRPGEILYRDVEKPSPRPGSVVIRVVRIGICGSDLHVFHGKHPLVSFPLVQGHEFSGYIDAVGAGVSGLSPGDLVTVQPAIGCGICPRCKEGVFAQCDNLRFIGGALEGGGSEFFLVDARHVVKLPRGVSADDAAMVEPLSAAVHAVKKALPLEGKDVLVLGGGPIGNLTAQVARLFAPGRIVVLERDVFRADVLRRLGFDTPASADTLDAAAVRERFDGRDPDIVFECVGIEATTNLGIRAVRRGGHMVVMGVYGSHPMVEMILVQDKEIIMSGSLMYTWDDYRQAVTLIAEHRVSLGILQTHHVPFAKWIDGYRLLADNSVGVLKVLVDV